MFIRDPHILSGIVLSVGIFGMVAAVHAILGVIREKGILDRIRAHVGGLSAVQYSDLSTEEWLANHQVPSDSHVADHVFAFVGGWKSGRLPTLGELHGLAARRERNRVAARCASGIAATLLIFGIAGTLLAIHPVLTGFSIPVAADGSTEDAAKGAADVTRMIRGLGTAFHPSLFALGATIVVVGFRGVYAIKASSLNQDLDRFSLGYLFPIFRLRSLAEDFVQVESKLSGLVDAIHIRDSHFDEAVTLLKLAAESINDAAPKLKKTADAVVKASEKLAADMDAVLAGLTKQFGDNSVLVQSLQKSAGAVEQIAAETRKLAAATHAIDARHEQLSLSIRENASDLRHAVASVAAQVATGVSTGKAVIVEAAKGMVDDVARAAKARVAKEVEPIMVELGNAGTDVAKTVSRLSGDVSQITRQIRASSAEGIKAIENLAAAAQEALKRAGETTDARIETADQSLRQSISHLTDSMEKVGADLVASVAQTNGSLADTIAPASSTIALAAGTITEAHGKLALIMTRIEELPGAASDSERKWRWFGWLRRKP